MKPAKILVNNEEGIQYITIAESLRKELDAYRNRYGFPSLAKEYHLAEDVRIEILSSDINPYIHIYTNPIAEGFITHPKSGDFKYEFFNKTDIGELGPIETQEQHYIVDGGGWDKNINPITTIYHIPAIDGDGGSSILTPVKDTASFKETHGEYSYGNIYWSNDNVTLSWKGPPSRHIPLQDHLNIPGLTVLDDIEEKTTGELRYYTAFGPNIYSKGSVLVTAPEYNWSGISNKPKVLGAAIQNNILVLIAGVNKRYNTEEQGFYDSVFISTNNKDWELIGEIASSRHRLPYFFNKQGTSAVNRERLLHINAIDKQVSLEILPNNISTNIEVSSKFWNLGGQSNSVIFREYDKDTLIELPAVSIFDENTTTTNTGDSITTDLPLYNEGILTCATIEGPNSAVVGSLYTLSGGTSCPENIVWSFSGGTIDAKLGIITSITGCGTAVVTATVGQCVSTKEVMLPSGIWAYVETVGTCINVCNDYGMPTYVDFYDGLYRYTTWVYWGPMSSTATCNSGVSVSGTSGGFIGPDGVRYLHLPAQTQPYPENRPCNNTPCGGYQAYSGCGVCGSCTDRPFAPSCYYAQCYTKYKWECP